MPLSELETTLAEMRAITESMNKASTELCEKSAGFERAVLAFEAELEATLLRIHEYESAARKKAKA